MTTPTFVILSGPNGAGKTTFARYNLQSFIEAGTFLNADDMARAVRPDNVEAAAIRAARDMLDARRSLLERGVSFCVETTLATRTLMSFVKTANDAGYVSRLIFPFTPFPQLNEMRVKQRVMAGGHNIDTDTIRRRHMRGLRLLADYWDVCSQAIVFDARTRQPSEIVRKDASGFRIASIQSWDMLRDRIAAVGGRSLSAK